MQQGYNQQNPDHRRQFIFLSPVPSLLPILHLSPLSQLSTDLIFLMAQYISSEWAVTSSSVLFKTQFTFFSKAGPSFINTLVSVSGNIATLRNLNLSICKHDTNTPLSISLPLCHASSRLLNVPLKKLCPWGRYYFVSISHEIIFSQRLSDLCETVFGEVRPAIWVPSDYALNHSVMSPIYMSKSPYKVIYSLPTVHCSSEK